jgi:hypothetical protein
LFRLTRCSFPAFSIHGLTKSLVQSLTPMFFSTLAFVFGMVTVVATTWTKQCVVFFLLNARPPVDVIQSSQTYRYATSVVWYTSQTTAECLISCKPHFSSSVDVLTFVVFLVRALLKARSGIQRSDLMVKFLVRNVIQTAALATIWAIASLISWFWLKHILVYRVFDITSGTVYTHVSVSSVGRTTVI